jgi:hypothetical protein
MYTGLIHISAYMHKNAEYTLQLEQAVPLYELNQAGIQNKVFKVSGTTKEECMENLKSKLDSLGTTNGTD